jgi:hypothetical protein
MDMTNPCGSAVQQRASPTGRGLDDRGYGPHNRCMRSRVVAGVLLAQLCGAAAAHAQALGDIARDEQSRRKTVSGPSKVYTNDSLRSEAPPASPATPSAATASPATPPAATPAQAAPAPPAAGAAASTPAASIAGESKSDVRDEKYWRGRIDSARTALARSQTLIEALQSRVNALSADFVNRDDPAQRNIIAAERQKALAEMDRLKQDVAAQQKSIVATQEEARRANVPAGWVR